MIGSIDPRETGPLELVERARSRVDTRIQETPTWQLVAIVAGAVGGWIYLGLSLPLWIWVVGLAIGGGAALAWIPARYLVDLLDADLDEILIECDPISGDWRAVAISEDVLSDMLVVDHEGRVHDQSYLHEIDVNGRRGFEVDVYLPEVNVAIASWMAGASNSQIRAHSHAVRLIKRQLSAEADRSLDELINSSEAVRQQGSEVANSLIRIAEGVESPHEDSVADRLSEIVEDQETIVDGLLDDRGLGDDRLADLDGESIEIEDLGDPLEDVAEERLSDGAEVEADE